MHDITPNLTPTYTAISRHAAGCPRKKEGITYIDCDCKKWIRVYDPRIADAKIRQSRFLDPDGNPYPALKGTHKGHSPFPAKTRSAADAETLAQKYRDLHDPKLRALAEKELEIKKLKREQQGETATVERAVAMFLVFKKDNPDRRSSSVSGRTSDETMRNYRALLGDVDPVSLNVRSKGRLFEWLDAQQPRPILISDLTPTVVDGFRGTWDFMDSTMGAVFTRLKTFFRYCKDRGHWIKSNPLDGIARPTAQEGSRTTAFTDEQYTAILSALAIREQNLRASGTPKDALRTDKKINDNQRLQALIELMRWSGMALHDAVSFRLSSLTGDELRYRRQKTWPLGKADIPAHVVDLLKSVVPINGDRDQPFRDVTVTIASDKGYWSGHIVNLLTEAGITTVKTDIRERNAHTHMLRDTFAVGLIERHIRDGKPSLKTIADALGDSIPVMLKHYAPVIDKLDRAHAEELRKVVAAQVGEMSKQSEQPRVVNIEAGRK